MFIKTSGVVSFWQLINMPYSFLGPLFASIVGFSIFSYVYEVIIVVIIGRREGRIENDIDSVDQGVQIKDRRQSMYV